MFSPGAFLDSFMEHGPQKFNSIEPTISGVCWFYFTITSSAEISLSEIFPV